MKEVLVSPLALQDFFLGRRTIELAGTHISIDTTGEEVRRLNIPQLAEHYAAERSCESSNTAEADAEREAVGET
jgi:hypothetical protein